MKYKIGQRVRLLASAHLDGVFSGDCGREGVIDQNKYQSSLHVKMIQPASNKGWWVDSTNIEPVIKKGQQLLFSFMEED